MNDEEYDVNVKVSGFVFSNTSVAFCIAYY